MTGRLSAARPARARPAAVLEARPAGRGRFETGRSEAETHRPRSAILGVLAAVVLLAVPPAWPGEGEPWPGIEAARRHRAEHGAAILADYARLLAIPNVPADPAGLRRTAESVRDSLAGRGVQARLLELPGVPPIVYGSLDVGAPRTLGIYVHYDGQPVDPTQWTWPPFEPTLASASIEDGGRKIALPRAGEPIDPEWRLYARSSGDDKAPLPAIYAALDALAGAGITPTSNLVFFLEGEEEQGSDHLPEYLERHRDLIEGVDAWLICDGPVHQSRRPQLVFGVRGYTGLDIRVFGATRYLHSGHYGNWAPNPALELARLLAGMKDATGNVTIAGFLDTVEPLGPAERSALEKVPEVDADLKRELGLARTEGEPASLAERLLVPSLNIRGMQSATVGESARNVIPTFADASLDVRLVQGNDPEDMLDRIERHIVASGFHIVRDDPDPATRLAHPRVARVIRRPGYPAARTRLDRPELAPVIAAARAASADTLILTPSLGGSLPLYLFTERLGKPLVIVPIANHDNNQHAPDENIRIANLWYGIDLFAGLFSAP